MFTSDINMIDVPEKNAQTKTPDVIAISTRRTTKHCFACVAWHKDQDFRMGV